MHSASESPDLDDVEVVIPRPLGRVRRIHSTGDGQSLPELMGIEENLFKEIVTYIRARCKVRGVNQNIGYRSQNPDILLKVKEETVREYPILGQYEHGWPITAFLKLDLRLRRTIKNKHSGDTSHSKPAPSQEIFVDRSETQDSESSSGRPSHTPCPITRITDGGSVYSTPQKTRSTPVVHASPGRAPEKPQIAPREQMRNRASQSTSLMTSTSSHRNCVESMCDSVAVQATSSIRSSNAVLGWIVSFDIPAADAQRITKLFASLGITDLAYLRAFARMESRDPWLREMQENGELSEIHVRILRDMLERVAAE